MSSTIRYFKNNFPDFADGQTLQVPRDAIQAQILAIKDKIVQECHLDRRSCNGGVYLGVSGVAYALTRLLTKAPYNNDRKLIEFTRQCIQISLDYEASSQRREVKPSLLVGTGGVLIAAALFHKQMGERQTGSENSVAQCLKSYGDLLEICNPPFECQDYLHCGSDEMLLGRAGYLCGVHTIAQKLSVQVLDEQSLSDICMTVVQVGRQTAKQFSSASPLMYQYHKMQCLGAAHGLSGILYSLLNFPAFVKSDPSIEGEIKATVDYFLTIQNEDGNFAHDVQEVGFSRPGGDLVHWCHGAPGIVYLLAKAYLFWGEEKYLRSCERCADVTWKRGLLLKGSGICHGIAGSGYVFLLMYRLTRQERYLYQAIKFAEFLESEQFKTKARTPDNPYSLYEGLAGTLCYLLDLLNPDDAEFPFMPVF